MPDGVGALRLGGDAVRRRGSTQTQTPAILRVHPQRGRSVLAGRAAPVRPHKNVVVPMDSSSLRGTEKVAGYWVLHVSVGPSTLQHAVAPLPLGPTLVLTGLSRRAQGRRTGSAEPCLGMAEYYNY